MQLFKSFTEPQILKFIVSVNFDVLQNTELSFFISISLVGLKGCISWSWFPIPVDYNYMCYVSERMTLYVVIRPPVLSGDNGNQDDNWEWEAEGGMSTCKCQLESHSANSVQNQTWKVLADHVKLDI